MQVSNGISFVENGDWVRYRSVNFGNRGAYGILTATVATPNGGGHAQLYIDGVPAAVQIPRKPDSQGMVEPPLTGTKIATLTISATSTNAGDFSTYQPEVTEFVTPVGGVHDVYVLFVKKYAPNTSGTGFGIGNFQSFQLAPTVSPTGAADALTSTANALLANGADAQSIADLVNRAIPQVNSVGVPPLLAMAATATLDRIDQLDSTFFPRFGSNVQSGNPLLVGQSMSEAFNNLQKIMALLTIEWVREGEFAG